MYIRAKHTKNRTYYAVVCSERKEGKVRQHVIVYMGKHSSLEAVISDLEKRIEVVSYEVDLYRNHFKQPQRAADAERRLVDLQYRLAFRKTLLAEMRGHLPVPL